MAIPDDFREWFTALPAVEQDLIKLLMQHASDKGLSAIEMADALESIKQLFISMHRASMNSDLRP